MFLPCSAAAGLKLLPNAVLVFFLESVIHGEDLRWKPAVYGQ
jgi:hypothetical protein